MSEHKPFQDDYIEDNEQLNEKPVSSRLQNSQFSVDNKTSKNNFDVAAQEYLKKLNDIKSSIAQLSTMFMMTLKDKTLSINKSKLKEEEEKKLIRDLIDLVILLDNDHNQPEGTGSAGCNMLLFRAVLYQRDLINSLAYELQLLKKSNSEKSD